MLILVAVVLILFLLVVPLETGPHPPPHSSRCLNHLRQIGIAMHMFAEDNNGKFPAQALATNLVAGELVDSQSPATCFVPLNPYLSSADVWICPADKVKVRAAAYPQLSNANVSYFYSLDATDRVTRTILAGDRHVTADGKSIGAGIVSVSTSSTLGWSSELHASGKRTRGCLLFADAHAEFVSTNLTKIFRAQPVVRSRLAIP